MFMKYMNTAVHSKYSQVNYYSNILKIYASGKFDVHFTIINGLCQNNIDSVYINNLEIMDLNLVGFLSLHPKEIDSSNKSKVLSLNVQIPKGLSSNSHSTS